MGVQGLAAWPKLISGVDFSGFFLELEVQVRLRNCLSLTA